MEASSGELSMGQLWRLRCGTSYIFLGLGGWQLIDGTFRQYRHLFPAYRQDSHLEVLDPHIAAKPKGSITNTCQLAGLELGPEGAGSTQEKESWSFMYLRYRWGCRAHIWWRSPLASSCPMPGRDPLAMALAGVLLGQWAQVVGDAMLAGEPTKKGKLPPQQPGVVYTWPGPGGVLRAAWTCGGTTFLDVKSRGISCADAAASRERGLGAAASGVRPVDIGSTEAGWTAGTADDREAGPTVGTTAADDLYAGRTAGTTAADREAGTSAGPQPPTRRLDRRPGTQPPMICMLEGPPGPQPPNGRPERRRDHSRRSQGSHSDTQIDTAHYQLAHPTRDSPHMFQLSFVHVLHSEILWKCCSNPLLVG